MGNFDIETLNETIGLTFKAGNPLKSEDLNTLVRYIESTRKAVNYILRCYCDINYEQDTQESFKLKDAIPLVPKSRRNFSMKIRFIENIDESNNNIRYAEYYYVGPKEFTDSDWNNEANWRKVEPNIIDGGTWVL